MKRPILRVYHLTYRWLASTYHALNALHAFLRACFAGFWLGVLKRETLLEIDDAFYSRAPQYRADEYNRRGLWSWEDRLVSRYFGSCKRVLVVGAGGGREVLALARRGYEVHGVECNADLVRAANLLLEREALLLPCVRFAPPDTCPDVGAGYDGLIIGWGAYMLIQGRARRVALLRSMRGHVEPGAPLIVSFFFRSPAARRFHVTAVIGNTLRWLLRRERVELGDALEPEYVHYFTKDQVAAELEEGGFTLGYYSEDGYGHCVGIAVELEAGATLVSAGAAVGSRMPAPMELVG